MLPHERTHSGPKEGRLRLLRATRDAARADLPALRRRSAVRASPRASPTSRAAATGSGASSDASELVRATELLIADGHHRYETALAYAEEGGSPWLMVVLVPPRTGLTIFPTHRSREPLNGASAAARRSATSRVLEDELARGGRSSTATGGTSCSTATRASSTSSSSSGIAPEASRTRPSADEAVAAVDRGDAEAAFLLRPTRIEDVFAAVARRGETMPQKSTYFYPKLTSGLLFHPLD